MSEEVYLRVAEAYHRDVGRGIARIDPEVMSDLKLQSGDIIEIVGKSRVPAIVWPGYPEDRGKKIIRIDGNIRSNAGVGIDDKVKIRRVDAKPAEKITLAPTEPVRLMGGEAYLKRLLEGRPVIKGQRIRVEVFGHVLTFVITVTKPSGVVIVGRGTQVELREKPAEEEKRQVPNITYEDIGGLKRELRLVREMIELPLKHPELFQRLGIEPPKGVLLYGPPGTGKTLMAKAVANEVDAHFISLSGPEIMSKYYGESEQRLREIFEEAKENAPSIIFIDEIDSIAPKREEVTGEVERRVVAQLLTLMDGLETRGQVIVIGATNRPDAVDPALRRPGRFDREIEIGVPDKEGRKEILQIHTRGMPIEPRYTRRDVIGAFNELKTLGRFDSARIDSMIERVEKTPENEEDILKVLREDEELLNEVKSKLTDVMFDYLAEKTNGFVGADLAALAKEAAMHALRKRIETGEIDVEAEEIPAEVLESLRVTLEDFEEALKNIEPSAMREVLVEVPNIKWDDIGGLEKAKQELKEAVEWPMKYPELFITAGIKPPRGILLYGPPGTGKTLLAKAVANESNANFISVKGPELLSKWVGESEKHVREMFRKARQVAPCVIFFDEIDSLAPRRGGTGDSHVTERVVSQLLTELDGLEELKDVVVIAATNRPDMIDPALLRPGRIERHIYIPPPDIEARKEIFRVHTRDMPLSDDVSFDRLAEMTDGYSGADIEAVCREAGLTAIREVVQKYSEEEIKEAVKQLKVTMDHFRKAIEKVRPSLTEDDLERYEKIVKDFHKMYS
ncbi:CDC48 family AAA ATPase [Geoglobus acetivorans]|uniref:Cell division protein FtsH n=1 Tax=Geoglobus acetivorans TaxID=565033 RepID=A0A0A7GG99_GEOAI|nr:Cell division protein FtsH [Geoglobus acetivorans]